MSTTGVGGVRAYADSSDLMSLDRTKHSRQRRVGPQTCHGMGIYRPCVVMAASPTTALCRFCTPKRGDAIEECCDRVGRLDPSTSP